MSDQSQPDTHTDESFLYRMSRQVDRTLQSAFYQLGNKISDRPRTFIIVPVLFTLLCLVGMILNFEVEANGEKLYTPQSSKAWDDNYYVNSLYPQPRPVALYAITPDGSNALTKANLLGFLSIYQKFLTVRGEYNGQLYGLTDVCQRVSGQCDVQSVLDFWNYNSTLIQNDPDVLATINGNATDRIGRPLRLATFIGGVQRDTSGNVLSASALRLLAFNQNDRVKISGKEDDDPESTAFESQAVDVLTAVTEFGFTTYVWSFKTQEIDFERAINGDVALFVIGYILLICYGALVLGRRNKVMSSAGLSFASVAAVGMAIVTSFGICLTLGVKFSLVVNTLAFVLLGIGMDDTFVIMGAYRALPSSLPAKERVSRALSHAGASITITSVTDFAAFLSGTLTIIPAINAFCIYAAVGIMFDFIYQITFFAALLVLDTRRQEAKRVDVFCCFKASEPADKAMCSDKKFDEEEPSLASSFMTNYYSKAAMSPTGKAFIILAALGISGIAGYGVTQLKSDFNYEWFAPDDSYLHEVYRIRDDLFEGQNIDFSIYTQEGDYFANQAQLLQMQNTLNANPISLSGFLISWQKAHLQYVQSTNSSFITNGVINDEAFFYSSLQTFLQGPGSGFKDYVLFKTSNSILSTRFPSRFSELSSLEAQLNAMDTCREISETGGVPGICYGFIMMYWEGEKVLMFETLRNVMVAAVAVLVVTLLLLAQLETSALVFLMIALSDFFIVGFIHIVGLTFNAVVAINLILAVGLSVDYSAHIAHTFATAQGTKQERAIHALSKMGPSVLNGGISTFLAIVILAAASSYIFRVFFRMFALIVGFGLFNGLALLPVLLSFVGPPPHRQEETKDVALGTLESGSGRQLQTSSATELSS